MIRNLLLIIFLTNFEVIHSQTIEFVDFDLRENLPEWLWSKIDNLKVDKPLFIDRTMNPFYLESDFNGDGVLDIAIFVKEKDSNKNGILIIHGKSFDFFLLGAGYKFGNGGDSFSWMKVWKVYRESTAEETTFTENYNIAGSKTVKLDHIAISVAPSEGASNLIVWTGDNYKWIHTGD